jgi:hypothetical protein
MSALAELNHYNTSAPSSAASTPYTPRSSTPELEYTDESTAFLRHIKLEDDDDVSVELLTPPTPKINTHQFPAPVRIPLEKFETIHAAREVKAKDDAALTTNEDSEAHAGLPRTSEVRRGLDQLYKVLCNFNLDNDDNDTDSISTRSSGWDDNDDDEYTALWPEPPTTPIEGDDMHVPQPQVCGQHPGQGWDYNAYGTPKYYRLLITDPSSGKNVVAPFLSYAINQSRPTISGTYGKGYPIKTRPLSASKVDYLAPTITHEQQTLFDSDAPFAAAIDLVLDKFAPYDLAASIRQYRYFKDTQYAIQASIGKLREKEMRYMERAVEILSDLENANALGRIFAHEADITQYLIEHSTPAAYIAYVKIVESFTGQVAHSALDTRTRTPRVITRKTPGIISLPRGTTTRVRPQLPSRTLDDEIENQLRRDLYKPRKPFRPLTNVPLHVHRRKRCHRCHEWGHIRRYCPLRPYTRLGSRK